MKKVFLSLLFLASFYSSIGQGVLGSDIYIKNYSGTRGLVLRRGVDLGTSDSTTQSILNLIKVSLQTGIGLDAIDSTNLAKIGLLSLAQAQTTSGQNGVLVLGAVSNNGYNYTEGKSYPLVMDARGNLKVIVAGGFNTLVKEFRPDYTEGDTASLNVDKKGQLRTTDTIQNDVLQTITSQLADLIGQGFDKQISDAGWYFQGNITTTNSTPRTEATANSFVKYRAPFEAFGGALGQSTALVTVLGTYTGALSLQLLSAGTATNEWYTVGTSGIATAFRNIETGSFSNTIPSGAVGIWEVNIAGSQAFRITALGSITGTATVSVATGTASNSGTPYIKALYDRVNDSIRVYATNGFGSGGSGGSSATVIRDSSGTNTNLTITNLSALASSTTAGWQSDRISNLTDKAIDYKISVKLTMSNTAPSSDKVVYVLIVPHYYDGSTWFAASQGTTTLPTGTQGTTTIAQPHNLRTLGVLSYTTQNMVLQDNFLLSNAVGDVPPDGFQIIIINASGSAVATTSGSNNIVSVKPVYKTQQ